MADTATLAEATQPEVSASATEATTDAAPAVETTQDEPVKADQTEEAAATEKNGDTAMEAGDVKEDKDDNAHKTRAHGHHHHDNKSKFDPSVLSVTDDPQKIRVQVRT
jgi:hypothetical protein